MNRRCTATRNVQVSYSKAKQAGLIVELEFSVSTRNHLEISVGSFVGKPSVPPFNYITSVSMVIGQLG